jgi:hypothetical protein
MVDTKVPGPADAETWVRNVMEINADAKDGAGSAKEGEVEMLVETQVDAALNVLGFDPTVIEELRPELIKVALEAVNSGKIKADQVAAFITEDLSQPND